MLMNKHQSEKQREIMHRDYVLLQTDYNNMEQ
jgi:hypothetical protein